jgi:hypothetical protein
MQIKKQQVCEFLALLLLLLLLLLPPTCLSACQGGTLITMLLSTMDAYNDKISVVMHMGPVVFIKYFQALFLKRQAEIRSDQVRYLVQEIQTKRTRTCA